MTVIDLKCERELRRRRRKIRCVGFAQNGRLVLEFYPAKGKFTDGELSDLLEQVRDSLIKQGHVEVE